MGYVFNGKWELVDNKLYLLDVKCTNKQNPDIKSKFEFKEHSKIFLDWFTWKITTYEGKLLEYSSMPLCSLYEINTFMEFEKGVLINTRTVKNEPRVHTNKILDEPEDDLPF